jgi:4-amino-4-deoxy-L-arabinose transferase-like glycosyltransferase
VVVRPSSRRANPDLALTVLVFLGLFAWFWAIQRGEFVSYDGRIMAGVARNLWERGSLRPFGDSFGTGLHLHWAPYGIAMSLLMAPLWGLQLDRDPQGAFWLTSPILTALTGALLYRIGHALGWRRTTAVIAAVAFGLLTMAAVYSTELFSEPAVTLGVVVVVLGLLRWRDDAATGPWLVGSGIAFTILARFDSVVLVLPVLVLVPLFVPLTRLRATWRRWVPALAIPLVLALGWTLYYNNLRRLPFDGAQATCSRSGSSTASAASCSARARASSGTTRS